MTRWPAVLAAAALAAAPHALAADAAYRVVGDAIESSLTGSPGDPLRGRALAAGRAGNCLACHPMPIPEEQVHGDIGPDLRGVGGRLSAGQIRLRLVDPKRVNPDTIMPAFHVVDGLERVARRYTGRPILDAGQIEDLVAWLATLTEP